MQVNRVARKVAGWINNSDRTQKILKGINRNPAIFSAVTSFGLASILRPLAIGVLPFKNKNDQKCSQASSVASGLTELAATIAIFIPLNKSIESASKSLYKSKGTFYEGNNLALRQFKSVTNRGLKLFFLIPVTFARFALVKPLMNSLFRDRKEVNEVVKGGKLDKWG